MKFLSPGPHDSIDIPALRRPRMSRPGRRYDRHHFPVETKLGRQSTPAEHNCPVVEHSLANINRPTRSGATSYPPLTLAADGWPRFQGIRKLLLGPLYPGVRTLATDGRPRSTGPALSRNRFPGTPPCPRAQMATPERGYLHVHFPNRRSEKYRGLGEWQWRRKISSI